MLSQPCRQLLQWPGVRTEGDRGRYHCPAAVDDGHFDWRSARRGRSLRRLRRLARAPPPRCRAMPTARRTTSWWIFPRAAISAPERGIATRAAALPTTRFAIIPTRCRIRAGCPTRSAYITASANSVTSNPVAVYVHAQVSSISLVGPQQCLSQGQLAQLDAQACYSSNGTQVLMCAPSTVTSANYACPLAPGSDLGSELHARRSARWLHARDRLPLRPSMPIPTRSRRRTAGHDRDHGFDRRFGIVGRLLLHLPAAIHFAHAERRHQWNSHPGRASEPGHHR